VREYSVVWLRQGNSIPRRKRLGNSRQRAESYLRAVQSTTPEERYGDKVDKPICCDGYMCACEGKTWREKWVEKFGTMLDGPEPVIAPLVYARIEMRQNPAWEPLDGDGTTPAFSFGEMIAPPEFPERPWMAVDPARSIALDPVSGELHVYGPRWTKR
jgi:hypothetical protein